MSNQLKLSAHIGYLFGELPLEQRVRAARVAGFDAVEHPQPFDVPARRMRALLQAEGLSFTQLAAGAEGRGMACLPQRRGEFRDALVRSLDYAEEVDCGLVHVMAGIVPSDEKADGFWDTYIENLRHASDKAARRGVSILIEPISQRTTPGYLVETPQLALKARAEAGGANVSLLLDSFHSWATGIEFTDALAAHIPDIGHIHVAGWPDRHEPDTGERDLNFLLPMLAERGYRGAVGFEYVPANATDAGLGWVSGWQAQRAKLLAKP